MADTISIEETNRIRVSLGLKPLPVPGTSGPVFKKPSSSAPEEEAASTLESRQAEGYENYRKLREAGEARRKREERTEAIKKVRDAAKRFTKLEGKGLGEASDGEDLDAKGWLMKQKKRQREIEKARKKAQELAEAEAAAAAAIEYTAKDLTGVKVGHELETFRGEEEQVLTLKDTTIDENEEEGDELENVNLREREKLQEKLELQKKKPVYNPNDIDETTEQPRILAQYDEEIDGKKSKKFTLNGLGSIEEQTEKTINGGIGKNKSKLISLDTLKDDLGSDYMDISEIKIRKPKKKKAKPSRQKPIDEDDIFPLVEAAHSSGDKENMMDIDVPATQAKKRSFQEASLVDDDELQASLSKQRLEALKKRKRVKPEDIAKQLREESSTPYSPEIEDGTGLVIDETSEFVANLQKPSAMELIRRPASQPEKSKEEPDINEDDDVDMDQSYAEIGDEEDPGDEGYSEGRQRQGSTPIPEVTSTGLEEEVTLDKGLGSTLRLLKERGIIENSESGDLNAIYRDKQKFLAEKRRREEAAELKARQQRERDRATGRLDRMTAREKEEYARNQNNYRDQQESRLLAEHFNREYKPKVELKYIDEFGRHMNQKEAFKHLSHQFHGKGSGKQKTEKMLKKIDDEKKRAAQSSLDASQIVGMSGAAGQQSKKQKQAGVRLA